MVILSWRRHAALCTPPKKPDLARYALAGKINLTAEFFMLKKRKRQ